MPRGGKVNKKGRARHFTSPEELERQNREDQKAWRAKKEESEEEDGEEDEASKSGDSDSEETSDDDKKSAKKTTPVEDVANPNRLVQKTLKVDQLGTEEKPTLSRREREELEKQRAREHYQKLHAQGKTEEARADLARLAIIRQQREEAARKREEERKMKEADKAAKTASIHKAIGKRT